jgi:hypothetical protein
MLISAFMVSGAGATTYTWTDYISFDPEYIGHWDSFSYTHDLTDNADPFNPGDDWLSDYYLEIALHDDGGNRDYFEVAYIYQPGQDLLDGFYDFSYNNNTFGWTLTGLAFLNEFGTLDVSITSLWGDFYLDYSNLVATGSDNALTPIPNPEPSTFLLLGSGLVGLAWYGRKRKKS